MIPPGNTCGAQVLVRPEGCDPHTVECTKRVHRDDEAHEAPNGVVWWITDLDDGNPT